MSRRRKLLLTIASIVVLLLLFITFILPVIVKAKAIEGSSAALTEVQRNLPRRL